jgi:DNA-binding LacI/PurR family transcriptional regulator
MRSVSQPTTTPRRRHGYLPHLWSLGLVIPGSEDLMGRGVVTRAADERARIMVVEGSVGRPRNPRMTDVARLAGVSHQTVSRVLNGSPNVSAQARERVERAIGQLGYRRNTAARALANRRTMNLGLVSVGTSQYGPSTTLFGISEAARQAGCTTSLVSLGDIDRRSMRAALDHLAADSVDGIIVLAPLAAAAAAVDGLLTGVPLVTFEPGGDNGTTVVAADEVLGARLATRHLLELGHDTVWHISGPEDWLGTDARVRGWREELAAHRRVARELIVGDWSAASGYRAGLQIVRNRDITAVFAANDQMALGVLKALHDNGVRMPEEVSVVGFDDIPEAEFFQPSLTTVKLDFTEVGRRCVDRLLGLIRDTPPAPSPAVQPQLVVRASAAQPCRRRHAPTG